MERLHLSPEGYTFDELRRLTLSQLRQGLRVFVLSFHSPSLLPGCTPYVKSQADLTRFLARLRRYLEFFLDELQGVSMSPIELKAMLETEPADERRSPDDGTPGRGDELD